MQLAACFMLVSCFLYYYYYYYCYIILYYIILYDMTCDAVAHSKYLLFADDIKIFRAVDSPQD
jgi:hypothetical protein